MEMNNLGNHSESTRSDIVIHLNPNNTEFRDDIVDQDNRPMHLPINKSLPQVMAEMPSRKLDSGMDICDARKTNIYCTMRRPRYNTLRIQKAAMSQMRDRINESEVIEMIVSDPELNQSSPESEQLRIETIRQIHCSLPKKRKLKRTFSSKIKQSGANLAWGPSMRFKMKQSFRFIKVKSTEGFQMIDLWHAQLRTIEGEFGRATAYYFRFLQRLVLLNCIIFLISTLFILTPQLLWCATGNCTHSVLNSSEVKWPNVSSDLDVNQQILVPKVIQPSGYSLAEKFTSNGEDIHEIEWTDFITGAGHLAKTVLYYGTYMNITISTNNEYFYKLPLAYLLATASHLLICLFLLAKWVGSAYKKHITFSSAFGAHTFCNMVFSSWDFSITSKQAAELKEKGLLEGFQEKLKSFKRQHCKMTFKVLCKKITKIVINHLVALGVLAGSGALTWTLLKFNKFQYDNHMLTEMSLSLIITAILIAVPFVFSLLITWEGYEEKVTEVCVTIVRMMLLLMTELGVLCYFWFRIDYEVHSNGKSVCWETYLGEEIYRLLLVDFVIVTIGSFPLGFLLSLLVKRNVGLCKNREFDLAWNTWNLIYTQMLCWLGSFYFPLVSGIILIKLLITFYIKQLHVRVNCIPPTKPWGTTQIKTIFLSYAFIGLIAMLIPVGYSIMVMTPSQNCGPFQGKPTVYQVILDLLGSYELTSRALDKLMSFITVPGCVAGILIVLCAITFQLKSHANATKLMVERMQHQLHLVGSDKIYLLRILDATMKALEKAEKVSIE